MHQTISKNSRPWRGVGLLATLTAALVLVLGACNASSEHAPRDATGAVATQPSPLAASVGWGKTGSLAAARSGHTVTPLTSGKVLVVGGSGPGGSLASAELYDPATGSWSSTGPLSQARGNHSATLLTSGKVLVVGGSGPGGSLASAELYDPATGSWSSTGSLSQARGNHPATLLPSGKVLVVGGSGPGGSLASAELYDPATGSWSSTGPLLQARESSTVTMLPSGKVLVVGGSGPGGPLASTELYDPATGAWSSTGSLSQAREDHTVTLLPSGRVLVAGGSGPGGRLASAELYDPATGSWSSTGSLLQARLGATATLLPSGRVLVAGGEGPSGTFVSTELYDPATGAWASTAGLSEARVLHAATLLPSGKVLVVGGLGTSSHLASAELFDPAAGSWTSTGSFLGRWGHTMTMLPSGQVLVAGGAGSSGYLTNAQVYDPVAGTWSSTGSLAQARFQHTATLLSSGRVLVVGGSSPSHQVSAEVYDPSSGTWTPTASLAQARDSHTATLLSSGQVLVVAGQDSKGRLSSTELYDPVAGTWSSAGALAAIRSSHTATLLPDGRVLVVGGYNGSSALASAEVYDPATGTWKATGSLAQARYSHTATLLPGGKVLVVGGYGSSRIATAELYDPVTGAWTATGSLFMGRYAHTATLLPNGKVLVASGAAGGEAVSELYDAATGSWTATVSSYQDRSSQSRYYHTATRLPSGKVLVAGGYSYLSNCDVYEDTDARPEWRPDIAGVSPGTSLMSGDVFTVNGSRLRGVPESDVPLLTLLDIERGRLFTLPSRDFSSTQVTASVPAVSPGQYLLSVIANGVTTSKVLSVVSDTVAPDTTIASAPSNPTNETTATFTFLANEAGVSFECRLDGAAFFTACTSPASYAQLAEGPHSFRVRARDAAGNLEASPASHTWTVDRTAPDTALTSAPANPSNQSTFTFSSEAGASFECSLDGAAFTPCTSPATYVQLAEGSHSFQVRARDVAGNVDATPAAHDWTVDQTAPDTALASAPANPSNQSTASFTFSSEAGASFECSLDGAAFTPCTSPATYVQLAEGSHSFQVRARDVAGNVDATPAAHDWTVDQTAPDTALTSAPASPSNQPTASFTFSSEASASFECSLDGAAFSACTSPATYAQLPEGPHSFRVRARDVAGNVDATPAAHDWTLDQIAPDTTLTSAPTNPSNQSTASFTFSSEAGASFECGLDGAAFTPCTSPATYAQLAEGSHSFQVRARDAVGNEDVSPASHTWLIDLTPPAAPVISAPANGATVEDNTPTFSGTAQPGSTVTLTVDGSVAGTTTADATGSWSFTPASALADGPHTVTATASDPGGTSAASPPASFTVDPPDNPGTPAGGCGCAAGSGDGSWLLAGLTLLAGAVSRRRRLLD
ncbi:kelch repeat-containing protein [Archangium lansingense]|uniref:Ig-like domain-containing protein n=1 Tax=Archangium lansingense TaxID=2995310 RepID=A0ABT3ZW05_9BACT|nr:kelch repeat-containing protein [Archangium lansinium]MCY1073568.1 Ig-like domain-containing protein [Archangium lansinium]